MSHYVYRLISGRVLLVKTFRHMTFSDSVN